MYLYLYVFIFIRIIIELNCKILKILLILIYSNLENGQRVGWNINPCWHEGPSWRDIQIFMSVNSINVCFPIHDTITVSHWCIWAGRIIFMGLLHPPSDFMFRRPCSIPIRTKVLEEEEKVIFILQLLTIITITIISYD